MDILHLPNEILSSIFIHLDMETKLSLYDVCRRFGEVLQSKKLMSYCKLTFCSKKLDALKHLSTDILIKLDVSGITNVTGSELISAIIPFTNLEDLNISYTNILMPDTLEICSNLPKLVTFCVNFEWKIDYLIPIVGDELLLYRNAFNNIEKLHFVTPREFMSMKNFIFMTEMSKVDELKITCYALFGHYYHSMYRPGTTILPVLPFKKFTLEVLAFYPIIHFLELTSLNLWEMIIIKYNNSFNQYEPQFFATENLLPTVQESVSVKCSLITKDMPNSLNSNYKIVMWHKDYYHEDLLTEIKTYLSSSLPVAVTKKNVDSAISYKGRSDTYFVCDCALKTNSISDINAMFPESCVIKKLTLGRSNLCSCQNSPRISLAAEPYALRHLTFLSVTNVNWSYETFKDLFTYCTNLKTFFILRKGRTQHGTLDLDFIRYSNSLKNIFIMNDRVRNIDNILTSLSNCATLEIVVLSFPFYWRMNDTISCVMKKCSKLRNMQLYPSTNIMDDIGNDMEELDILFPPSRKYRRRTIGTVDSLHNQTVTPQNPYEQVFLLRDDHNL